MHKSTLAMGNKNMLATGDFMHTVIYGPPGTGKTLLAKALSNELKANFIAFDAPQIMAKYVGEAEERLRQIFKKAQSKTPAIIFIDEIDAIAPKRENLVNEV